MYYLICKAIQHFLGKKLSTCYSFIAFKYAALVINLLFLDKIYYLLYLFSLHLYDYINFVSKSINFRMLLNFVKKKTLIINKISC